MRDKVSIGGLGEITLVRPRSFVSINDLVSEYSANQNNKAKLARLSAAAMCICWCRTNTPKAPLYDVASGEIIAYGGQCLEWLIGQGVDLKSLYAEARPLFLELWDLIPKAKEVDAEQTYFPDQQGQPRSNDNEDREAVG